MHHGLDKTEEEQVVNVEEGAVVDAHISRNSATEMAVHYIMNQWKLKSNSRTMFHMARAGTIPVD